MTGQSRSFDDILKARLKIIQAIAEANTEQLRLNQKSSGMMVLGMKIDRDGVADSSHVGAHEDAQARLNAALEDNSEKINRLEQQLTSLDEELEAAVRKEG